MSNEASGPVTKSSNLISLIAWIATLGVRPITAWRWRRKGWLRTVNICGRVYISREAIAEFERRAAAGEFAQVHRFPSKQTTQN